MAACCMGDTADYGLNVMSSWIRAAAVLQHTYMGEVHVLKYY